jgi:DNA repair protein RadA/Sms
MQTSCLERAVIASAARSIAQEGQQMPEQPMPLPDGITWLGDVVGEVCEGYLYLVGGPPGSMKSRLFTQLAVEFARQGKTVSFLLNEEREHRLRSRVSRLLSQTPAAEVQAIQARLLADDSLHEIDNLPAWVASQMLVPTGRHHRSRMLVIDSLMGHGLPATSGRRWERIFEGLRLLRQSGVTTFAIAHVTKSNAIGGPRTLSHNVDTVLMLRQVGAYRCLYSLKNRNGPADPRRPAKLQIDPTTLALEPAAVAEMQVVSARTIVAGVGPIEVQAGVGLSLGTRRRIIGSHLPRRELEQLLDVIGGVPDLNIDDLDFSISCRLPGGKGYAPSMGLPLCMALIGSATQRPIPPGLIFLGEVDLLRSVRDISMLQAESIRDVLRTDSQATPCVLVCSQGTAELLGEINEVRFSICQTLDQAVAAVWQDGTAREGVA